MVIIPGYGMAVAQAQHRVRELYDALTKKGVDVKFAVHPVAGRMPGHMNVLLAEAEIPYDKLIEMEEINPEMPETDVALVIGANDVVNPAARHDKSSPIFGMPIIDADKAKTVFVIKRSMNPGFAGIENELFFADNTLMLFGDAKAMLTSIVQACNSVKHTEIIMHVNKQVEPALPRPDVKGNYPAAEPYSLIIARLGLTPLDAIAPNPRRCGIYPAFR